MGLTESDVSVEDTTYCLLRADKSRSANSDDKLAVLWQGKSGAYSRRAVGYINKDGMNEARMASMPVWDKGE